MGNVLYHHGVKGMKWGVRRSDRSTGGSGGASSRRKGVTANEIRTIKKSVDSTNQAVTEARNINRSMSKNAAGKVRAQANAEMSTMSDKELRERVNRMNMERQYADLMESKYVSSGHARTEKILSNAGTILTIGSTALSIALAIKQLKE